MAAVTSAAAPSNNNSTSVTAANSPSAHVVSLSSNGSVTNGGNESKSVPYSPFGGRSKPNNRTFAPVNYQIGSSTGTTDLPQPKVGMPVPKLTPADVPQIITPDTLYSKQYRSRMWLVLLAASIIILVVYVPLDWYYKSDLYPWGIDVIVDMQSNDHSSATKSMPSIHDPFFFIL
jgi:hypothetical protein